MGIRQCNPNELTLEGIRELQELVSEARVLLADGKMIAESPQLNFTPEHKSSLVRVWAGKVSAFLERSY